MDRMDIYHKLFQVARKDILHSAPLVRNYDQGPRIMDLGTGTGIWAIDVAEYATFSRIMSYFSLTLLSTVQIQILKF
jgi:ubiquinone/menaquinone biosynthesis C-methylase UbiE